MSDVFDDPHPINPRRDITRRARETNAPAIVLVEPQMGENIGTTARAMANFGLAELRLVAPRDGWPNPKAYPAAAGANRILDEAKVYDTLAEAIADLTLVLATTARLHDQHKPTMGPSAAVAALLSRARAGERTAIVFGRERNGLLNQEVSLCDAILTYPVNPEFSSLNLAQSVLVMGFAWHSAATDEALPPVAATSGSPAGKAQVAAFFDMFSRELDRLQFFRPPEKRETMLITLRNIVARMAPTAQELSTLHGAIATLAEGAKGPASGGTDPAEAQALREAIADIGAGERSVIGRAPTRGLAKLLRRNPTPGEKALWEALTKDRRFAGLSFKRAVPIGPHVADIVSLPLRLILDIRPVDESDEMTARRADKRAWLEARRYRVASVDGETAARDPGLVLDALVGVVADAMSTTAEKPSPVAGEGDPEGAGTGLTAP